jgi:hypothetical protein
MLPVSQFLFLNYLTAHLPYPSEFVFIREIRGYAFLISRPSAEICGNAFFAER